MLHYDSLQGAPRRRAVRPGGLRLRTNGVNTHNTDSNDNHNNNNNNK